MGGDPLYLVSHSASLHGFYLYLNNQLEIIDWVTGLRAIAHVAFVRLPTFATKGHFQLLQESGYDQYGTISLPMPTPPPTERVNRNETTSPGI